MAEDKKILGQHNIVLNNRTDIFITGIKDVISFDEEMIVADTQLGVLVLKGLDLHVNKLNLDKGELDIDGEISSLMYENEGSYSKGKGSFFGKIFK